MSEAKFVVGQWVTCFGRPFRVKQITEQWMHADEGYSTTWANVEPFVWQVGKTYKTTLDGVTATIDAETTAERVVAIISNGSRLSFSGVDGELMPMHKKNGWPTHLLPYRADEPPPVAEAATFSEFAEADECDEPSPLESLLEEFKLERKSCESRVATWEARAAAWRQAEQAVIDRIERAKR